jgi:uncharacterized integral membrane protein
VGGRARLRRAPNGSNGTSSGFLALLIGFVLDNRKTVRVGFVFFNANVRLIWVLLIAAFLGGLVDRLVVILRRRQKKGVTKD